MTEAYTVWFTGKPFTGKTTAAQATLNQIENRGFKVEIIDEDDIFRQLWGEAQIIPDQRETAEKLIAYFCRRLNLQGIICLVAAVSPQAEAREIVRKTVRNFVEVQCSAPEEIIKARAEESGADSAAGDELSQTYETPDNPALLLKTDITNPDLCAAAVVVKLQEMGYIEVEEQEYSDEERKEIDERLKSLGYM